jgi:DNA polymerase-3 subunit gamma/tau
VKIPEKSVEKREGKVSQPQIVDLDTPQEAEIKKTTKPLTKQVISTGFSINALLNKEEKTEDEEEKTTVKTDNLPQNHFTETDLQAEWGLLLKQLQKKDTFVFNAIKSFKIIKSGENQITVLFPSDSAKSEFDKVSREFFNHFKTKVHNFSIEIIYKRDVENLKIEVMTKRKIFEKFVQKNPLLKDLDDLMRFDLT